MIDEQLGRDAHLRELSERPPFVDLQVGPGLEPDNRRFGELLERLRKHAGLSRRDAATALGLSAEYLRLIETGKRTPALGQMRNLLDAYGADGAVEEVMPGGDRPDLVVIDPFDREPVIVEFKSRIREARHRESDIDPVLMGALDVREKAYGRLSPSRATQIGVVVSLLARADEGTIRQVREMLEEEVGNGAVAED